MMRFIRFMVLALLPLSATAGTRTEILWDRYGVPHIYGASAEEAFRGLGYAQMANHAEWLLLNVAAARGRYAEYFGPGTDDEYVRSDEYVRTMDIARHSQEWLRKGGADQRRYVTAFVAGANAYAKTHSATITPRIRAVLPLRETDPFALWQWTVQFGFQSLASRGLVADWLKTETGVGLHGAAEPPRRAASNGWALGPVKTVRGTTILVGNPHLDFGGSGLVPASRADTPERGAWHWMQSHLVVGDPQRPAVNLTGVGFLGVPVISIGFNDHLAWTHTDNRAQTSNVYELTLQGDRYRWDG